MYSGKMLAGLMGDMEQEPMRDTESIVRRSVAILVGECQALGMIAVVRSLGRAGYIVHAGSNDHNAIGFHSSFCSVGVCHPPYADAAFLPWLQDYIQRNRIEAIIPSEAFLHAIRSDFETYRALIPDPTSVPIWDVCLSKVATQRLLSEFGANGQHLPPGGIITSAVDVPNLTELGRHSGPFYLKADSGHGIGHTRATVIRCEDASHLIGQIELLRPSYHALLWQAFAPGMKVGVSLWRHQGEVMAESMVFGLHMHPHVGGMMSLRKTFWHEAILADAKQKLERLGWQGVAMMEYKWDPATDEFWFIEINARYWGYLHLDLFAGKDFPRLQLDAHFGKVASNMGPPRSELYCRDAVPGEVLYLVSVLKDAKVPWRIKAWRVLVFAALFFHPTMKADLLFPSDRSLYWRAWLRFLSDLVAARWR